MVKEAYVSLEVAKLLKEKGFDIECKTAYYCDCLIDYTMFGFCGDEELVFAPTQQMAMAWLREKKIFINVWYDKTDFSAEYVNGYFNYIGNFDSYEEAVEQSIKYVLEHVI